MKIIISHDVDHLLGSDHLKDLFYPKLFVRETLAALKGQISLREWGGRMASPFRKERNFIKELIAFDSAHGVKSSFFFGMEKGLGLSYDFKKAAPYIEYVREKGFIAGVHGINYTDIEGIAAERQRFKELSGEEAQGIRMHYVRFDEDTFNKLDKCGYSYDSTEFDKKTGSTVKEPYRVGKLWEFPLCIMDGYLPYKFEEAKERTLELLKEAEEKNLNYFTVLFHDCMFCPAWGETEKWYRWLIEYLEQSEKYEFISFAGAVKELEEKHG